MGKGKKRTSKAKTAEVKKDLRKRAHFPEGKLQADAVSMAYRAYRKAHPSFKGTAKKAGWDTKKSRSVKALKKQAANNAKVLGYFVKALAKLKPAAGMSKSRSRSARRGRKKKSVGRKKKRSKSRSKSKSKSKSRSRSGSKKRSYVNFI